MANEVPLFTREEMRLFWFELKSKFRGGVTFTFWRFVHNFYAYRCCMGYLGYPLN